MKKPFDIRAYKRGLRAKFRKVRQSMEPQQKTYNDSAILARILASPQYKNAAVILAYVSTPIEVDTHMLINHALSDGKRVAVPFCVEGTRKMHFYFINSLDELSPRTFGVLEPDPKKHERLREFAGSLCILPGLSYDRQGYRLGYGGGYYDRFLSQTYTGITLGVCYNECMVAALRHGQFDFPCQYLVTQTGMLQMQAKKRAPASRNS